MDGIPELTGLWNITPWGALIGLSVLIVVSLVRGWLIPKSTHEREIVQERQRGDEWKESTMVERAVTKSLHEQNADLIQAQKVFEQFLRAASPPFDEDTNPRGKP